MKKSCGIILALALAGAPLAHAAYKCVDEKGETHFGDVPPAGCANVVMYEVTPSGTVLRKIDPTPTPEQAKAMREEQARRKEADRAAAEQRRKDLALVNTYSSEQEIDVTRDRNLEPIRGRIKAAQERIAEVDKLLKKNADDMEFYKSGHKGKSGMPEVPPLLLMMRDDYVREKASLQASIADSQKEIETVRARYEADKRRYAQLRADPSLLKASERNGR